MCRLALPFRGSFILPIALLYNSFGCLEREETLTVAADGGVTMEVRCKGTPQEFQTEDALPTPAAGWPIVESTVREGDQDKLIRSATRVFSPGDELPRSFTVTDAPDAGLALDFPTQVEMQREADGVYYHFRRSYANRPWAYVQYWHDRFLNDDVRTLLKKDEQDLTDDERAKILQAIFSAAARQQAEFADAALQRVAPDLPQHHKLAVRKAVLAAYEELDCAGFVRTCSTLQKDQRDQKLDRLSRELMNKAAEAGPKSLRTDARLNEERIAAFQTAFDRVRRHHAVTEQTGAHAFRIRVRLPGRVIAHNADQVEADGTLLWEFNGQAFRDRPFELLATARAD